MVECAAISIDAQLRWSMQTATPLVANNLRIHPQETAGIDAATTEVPGGRVCAAGANAICPCTDGGFVCHWDHPLIYLAVQQQYCNVVCVRRFLDIALMRDWGPSKSNSVLGASLPPECHLVFARVVSAVPSSQDDICADKGAATVGLAIKCDSCEPRKPVRASCVTIVNRASRSCQGAN
jgi:hypothetical protein